MEYGNNKMVDALVETIRRVCREKHVSITQMENDLGFSAGLISRWSKTKTSPSFDKIVAIMEYLDISYEELMGKVKQEEETSGKEQSSDLDLCRKLLEDSEGGRIEWFDACENMPFSVCLEKIFPEWSCFHVHRIYYAECGGGYFFMALEYNFTTFKMNSDLYMLAEEGLEPKIIRCGEGYAKKLLKYVDGDFYTEYDRRKAEKMEADFLGRR